MHQSRRFAATKRELYKLQRCCDRLAQFQRRIKFAPLENITFADTTLSLPLAAIGPLSRCPSQGEIEYLVGFFDGDGCVSMRTSTGQIRLQVGQSFDSAIVLARFRDILGGGIYHHTCGTGSCKAMLQWEVTGTRMRQAAHVLCSVPSMKHAQLQIATRGTVPKEKRIGVAEKLSRYKQREHKPEHILCSWPYLAGFFDAEGSITVCGSRFGLRLSISQLNSFVLEELQAFLHQDGLNRWSVSYGTGGCSVLVCQHLATCKLTLQRLLDSGLDVKKKQADLAMSLTRENHKQVREAMFQLNGLQTRHNRLDDWGIDRAKEILRVREKLRKASSEQFLEMLQVKLSDLCEEHVLQKLVTKRKRLRQHIRQSLGEGGVVVPL